MCFLAGICDQGLSNSNVAMATRLSFLSRSLLRHVTQPLTSPADRITSHSALAPTSTATSSFFQQCRSFVQMRTRLEVADNSGAKRVSCIKVLGGGKHGKLGDLIIASVKDAVPRGKVKKGEVVNCVIVRAAMHRQRSDGSEIRFDKNAVVIVNKQGEPIGTRIFGPVPHELRMKNFMKILTLADHVT